VGFVFLGGNPACICEKDYFALKASFYGITQLFL